LALQEKFDSNIKYKSPQAKVAFFSAIIPCGGYGYQGRDVPLYNLLLALANTVAIALEERVRVEYSIELRDGASHVIVRSVSDDLPGLVNRLRERGVSAAGIKKIADGASPKTMYTVSSKGLVREVNSSEQPGTIKTACEGSFGPIYSEF